MGFSTIQFLAVMGLLDSNIYSIHSAVDMQHSKKLAAINSFKGFLRSHQGPIRTWALLEQIETWVIWILVCTC